MLCIHGTDLLSHAFVMINWIKKKTICWHFRAVDKFLRLLLTVADPRGRNGPPPPPPNRINCGFLTQFFIRMLKNKAPKARESNKTTLELPGPPAESEFVSLLVMCVRAHNLLRRPPPPQKKKKKNPGTAPDHCIYKYVKTYFLVSLYYILLV